MPLKQQFNNILSGLNRLLNPNAATLPTALIDEPNRRIAAWQIRQYVERIIEIENMLEDWPIDLDLTEQQDAAVIAIGTLLRRLVSDEDTLDLLTKVNPETGQNALLQRCYQFLNSNIRYEWPVVDFTPLAPQPWYVHVGTLGASYWWEQRAVALHEANIDSMLSEDSFKHWPFQWASDYEGL